MIIDKKTKKNVEILMSFKEFNALMEKLEDLHDLNIAYERSLKNEKTVPLEEVMKELLHHGKRK